MNAAPSEMTEIQGRARAWAQVLRLPFRQQRWRGQAGGFMGQGTGSSLEFQDHRAYVPGDDPRQINWQAYARTGSYTMKVHREEVRPQVDVLLDASASMSAYPIKWQRTLELLAFSVEHLVTDDEKHNSEVGNGSVGEDCYCRGDAQVVGFVEVPVQTLLLG